jgi:hypothetical protein
MGGIAHLRVGADADAALWSEARHVAVEEELCLGVIHPLARRGVHEARRALGQWGAAPLAVACEEAVDGGRERASLVDVDEVIVATMLSEELLDRRATAALCTRRCDRVRRLDARLGKAWLEAPERVEIGPPLGAPRARLLAEAE